MLQYRPWNARTRVGSEQLQQPACRQGMVGGVARVHTPPSIVCVW